MRKPGNKPEWQKRIARERIGILFSIAGKEFKKHPERSHRYVEIALKIGKRYNVRLGKDFRGMFCRKCGHYMKQGANSRTRTSGGRLVVECRDCGNVSRRPYK